MTSRTDSRIRSTPSPARNASSSSDATDWDNAIGGNLPGEYLPVHTENPADGPLTQAGSPTTRNPTTPGDSHRPEYRGSSAQVPDGLHTLQTMQTVRNLRAHRFRRRGWGTTQTGRTPTWDAADWRSVIAIRWRLRNLR